MFGEHHSSGDAPVPATAGCCAAKVRWAVESGKAQNNPFTHFAVQECVYGTPYYITIEERNKLYHTNLDHNSALAVQRDIFVFQCLIGCRVGDLYNLTKSNVINEVASSHLARRCFVGNLYKQVKDPNLVGALSGHKEGSRAFARYREIDEDMKRDLVSMLE